jgi:hypothetical protein
VWWTQCQFRLRRVVLISNRDLAPNTSKYPTGSRTPSKTRVTLKQISWIRARAMVESGTRWIVTQISSMTQWKHSHQSRFQSWCRLSVWGHIWVFNSDLSKIWSQAERIKCRLSGFVNRVVVKHYSFCDKATLTCWWFAVFISQAAAAFVPVPAVVFDNFLFLTHRIHSIEADSIRREMHDGAMNSAALVFVNISANDRPLGHMSS